MAALGAALAWLTAGSTVGPAMATLLSLVGGICFLAFSLLYRRYIGVLGAGAEPEGSPERQAYDVLRESLVGGNLAGRLYARWLTGFLDAVDRFFGDSGITDRTLFPHAFGLKKPAPLWTAPSFDRCLLLALVYPIVTIFGIWAVSGHVGPAENALGLDRSFPAWRRGLATALIGFVFLIGWQPKPTFTSIIAGVCAIFGVIVVAIGTDGAPSATGLVSVFIIFLFCVSVWPNASFQSARGAFIFSLIFIQSVVWAFPGKMPSPDAGAENLDRFGAFGRALAFGWISIFGVAVLIVIALKYGRLAVFFLFFLPAMILACLAAAASLSHEETWEQFAPLLLFLGLLTLLNAPFDWASLGLTRALLRRGLELGGWWPYLLALVDAALAAVIIACLALVMVIGVQAFDELAAHGGGAPPLPLDKLFDGIAKNPAAPEYWWVYALLLSSMIPSFINLMIGGASLVRGIPGLPTVVLGFLPVGKAVPSFDRAWIALVLTGQIFLGAALGIAAQVLAAWIVIGYVMPWLGQDLLDMARAVAAYDLPARVGALFASAP
jgi:hypothetical protein